MYKTWPDFMIVQKYKAINTCAINYSDRSFDGTNSYCCSIHLWIPSISLWWHHKRAPPDTAPSSGTASVQPFLTQTEGTCSHYLSSSWRRKSLEKQFKNLILNGKISHHLFALSCITLIKFMQRMVQTFH